jgi:hypothetical protein
MANSDDYMNSVDYKNLLQELFCCIDQYLFSRVVPVTPKLEKFINDIEPIRLRLKSAIDTRNDGK